MPREAGRAAVRSEHDIGVENGDERVEVALLRGRLESLDDPPLGGQVGVWNRGRTTHAAAGAAGELAGRLGGALHDGRDLLERYGEHVVQNEGQSLGRGQR